MVAVRWQTQASKQQGWDGHLDRSRGSCKALVSCSMRDPDVRRRALQERGSDSGWLSMCVLAELWLWSLNLSWLRVELLRCSKLFKSCLSCGSRGTFRPCRPPWEGSLGWGEWEWEW